MTRRTENRELATDDRRSTRRAIPPTRLDPPRSSSKPDSRSRTASNPAIADVVILGAGVGVNVKFIDRNEVKQLEPDWSVDEVELAVYEPDDPSP